MLYNGFHGSFHQCILFNLLHEITSCIGIICLQVETREIPFPSSFILQYLHSINPFNPKTK